MNKNKSRQIDMKKRGRKINNELKNRILIFDLLSLKILITKQMEQQNWELILKCTNY